MQYNNYYTLNHLKSSLKQILHHKYKIDINNTSPTKLISDILRLLHQEIAEQMNNSRNKQILLNIQQSTDVDRENIDNSFDIHCFEILNNMGSYQM